MFRNTVLLLVFLLISGIAPPPLQGDEPEIFKQAAQVIDLSRIPLYPGHELIVTQRVEHLYYISPQASAPQEITEFHRNQLVQKGAKVIGQLSSSTGSLSFFLLDGFMIQMHVKTSKDRKSVAVHIGNKGNIDLMSLPRNRGSKVILEGRQVPGILSFVVNSSSGRPFEKILQENHDLLTQAGWTSHANEEFLNQMFPNQKEQKAVYSKDGYVLKVERICSLDAKAVKIGYHPYLNSVIAAPPPAMIEEFHFTGEDDLEKRTSRVHTFNSSLTEAEITDYYRAAFEKLDWKEIPSADFSAGSTFNLTFENSDRYQMLIEIVQGDDKRTVNATRRDRLDVLENEKRPMKEEKPRQPELTDPVGNNSPPPAL